jgi:hypothetical protein
MKKETPGGAPGKGVCYKRSDLMEIISQHHEKEKAGIMNRFNEGDSVMTHYVKLKVLLKRLGW